MPLPRSTWTTVHTLVAKEALCIFFAHHVGARGGPPRCAGRPSKARAGGETFATEAQLEKAAAEFREQEQTRKATIEWDDEATRLSFCFRKMGDSGAIKIAEHLREAKKLTALNLEHNM